MEKNDSDSIITDLKLPQPDIQERGVFTRIRNYFFAGLLVTGPALITLYLVWAIVTSIDAWVMHYLPARYNPSTYFDVYVPGVGVIVVITGLVLIGMFAANFMGRFFVNLSDKILNRMPFIKGIYSATKQIMETVFANKSKAFREVVLVEYPRRGMWVIGFVTAKTSGEIQNASEVELVNVFVPTTPNPTSGFLIFIPQEDVYTVDMTVEEGLKLVISGGIITPPDKRAKKERTGNKPIRSREILKD